MIALKKTMEATKRSDHRTISLTVHAVQRATTMLRRRIERKMETVLGENQFGFRRGTGTRDAIGMLKIISERTLKNR
jgi:hypothetical protein